MEHWLSVSAGIFLAAMVLYGHYRGFLRMAVTMLALVISTVIVRSATPYITTFLKENTQIQEKIQSTLSEAAGLSGSDPEIHLPAQQRIVIEGLELPRQMKEILLENNNNEIYRILGADTFLEYIGSYITNMILNLAGSVILFILVNLILRFLIRWFNLLTKLPILSGMNQIAGALLGGVEGLLCLWAGCVAVDIFSRTEWAAQVLNQIQGSVWLTFLYNNNLINWFFINLMRNL